MENRNLVLIGVALIVIGTAVVLASLFVWFPAANVNATTSPTATTVQTAGALRAGITLSPADALDAAVPAIQGALDRIDNATATAAKALGPTDMAGNEARRILRALALASPAAIDATAVSSDGIMLTVEPGEYSRYEGSDISDQEQVRRVRETGEPAMSGVFQTVEGVNATDLEHPVNDPAGRFNGSASLLFNPTVLLTIAVQEALGGRSAEIFVVDTDGLVLYDRDPAEIGANTFTDARYAGNTELLAIAERMRTESTGTGTYTFAAPGSSTPVRKEVVWTSVGLHGTAWRVVAANATAPT